MRYNLNNMMCLDIFLSGLPKSESKKSGKQVNPLKFLKTPLMCWDFFNPGFSTTPKLSSFDSEINVLVGFAKKFKWEINIEEILDSFPYEALVLTDNSQKIIWVNDGFETMTGYPKSKAINHTPSFLQGPETTKESTNNILYL